MSKKTAIRTSAQGKHCTFRLPFVCSFDPEQTVLCHAPQKHKGRGLKGPDYWAAYGCYACHMLADKPTDKYWDQHNFYQYWMEAVEETQAILAAEQLLRVA